MNGVQMMRGLQTATSFIPRLTKFSLHAPKRVEVGFVNGEVFNLSAEFLRIYSPAANSMIRSVGGEKVIFGRRHVGIMSVEPVGNYGQITGTGDLKAVNFFKVKAESMKQRQQIPN